MDSIFEKITLYDILGYLFPGAVFVLLVGAIPFFCIWTKHYSLLKDCGGGIILCALLISYVAGVALSELSNILVRERNRDEETVNKFLADRHLEPVDLINRSGIVARKLEGGTSLCDCFQIIYADIQTDSAFRRIHNYASAEVMCKNMFMALAAGGVFFALEYVWDWRFCGFPSLSSIVSVLIIAGMAVLYFFRWKRFYHKKLRYTFLWFEEKVSGREIPGERAAENGNG